MQQSAASCIQRLKHLKTLYDAELITQQDFETRKTQIVDQLTGTSSGRYYLLLSTLSDPIFIIFINIFNSFRSDRKRIQVIAHPPPNWQDIRSEIAEKWTYFYSKDKWYKRACKIKIDTVPFAKGTSRYMFYLQDMSYPNKKYVLKMAQNLKILIKKAIYFDAVKNQTIARYFCHESNHSNGYNACKSSKQVKMDFLESFVLHLKQRQGSPVCHVEEYFESYRKYQRVSYGIGCMSDNDRNVLQAFAHFTFEASKRKLIVWDILRISNEVDAVVDSEGNIITTDILISGYVHNVNKKLDLSIPDDIVGIVFMFWFIDYCNVYSEPQVYTRNGRAFDNFIKNHRCNKVCEDLGLRRLSKSEYVPDRYTGISMEAAALLNL